jgi:hypothetical protein
MKKQPGLAFLQPVTLGCGRKIRWHEVLLVDYTWRRDLAYSVRTRANLPMYAEDTEPAKFGKTNYQHKEKMRSFTLILPGEING